MTFLPIVERELRVAARQRFTYWSRLVAAGFLLLVFGFIVVVANFSGGGFYPGQVQFTVLKWIAFIFACSAGIFLTSDSLSEEKREGTLGLLFLTDLRGHDVVLGKLMSHSLQAFYGLVAGFPILALPLLSGGVTGTEFAHAMAIIGNTLFFSLALGMFISSISREVLKALNAAFWLSVIFLVGLPWLDWMIGDRKFFHCVTSIASPGYLFVAQDSLRPGEFWFQLGLQHILAWSFLAAASFCLPRAWHEKTAANKGPRQNMIRAMVYGSQRMRLALRRKLLELNPILWLASRERWMPRLIWTLTGLLVAVSAWEAYVSDATRVGFIRSNVWGMLYVTALFLWVGSQSCRIFLEAVRNGAMELILVTPIQVQEIVSGQWRALKRTFLLPVICMMLVHLYDGMETIWRFKTISANSTPSIGFNMVDYQIVNLASWLVTFLSGVVAISWFGMWMGLTTRKVSVAVLKTILFVTVLPWLAESFIQIAIMLTLSRLNSTLNIGGGTFWISTAMTTLMELGKNVFFVMWARKRLMGDFRTATAQSGQSIRQRIAARKRPFRPAAPSPVLE